MSTNIGKGSSIRMVDSFISALTGWLFVADTMPHWKRALGIAAISMFFVLLDTMMKRFSNVN